MPAKIIRLKAPAKLNLWLKILGRRADGYHELDTLMCPVSLYDELIVELGAKPGITLAVDDALGQGIQADNTNLAYRAAALFLAHTGQASGVDIRLKKNIPAGAGLGGGSSDAAAVLYGLNVLHGNPIAVDMLAQLALQLGADVPFFLLRRPARATGIGEKLVICENAFRLAAAVVFPGVAAPTAKIYRNLKLALTNTSKHSICLKAQKEVATPDLGFTLQNDLEASALELYPEIGTAKNALKDAGFAQVLMSGSGSAVFGLCSDLTEAQRLVAGLKIKSNWRVFTVDILNKFDIVL